MTGTEIGGLITAALAAPGLWKLGDRILDALSKKSAADDARAKAADANANASAADEIVWLRNELSQERARRDDVTSRFTTLTDRVGRTETTVEHLGSELEECQRQHADCREGQDAMRAELTDLRTTISVIKPDVGSTPPPKGPIA